MPMSFKHRKNHVGEQYGRLTIIADVPDRVSDKGVHTRMVSCLCVCGNVKDVSLNLVRTKNTKSCGCQKIDSTSKRMTKHSLTKTTEGRKVFTAWYDIKRRCYKEDHEEYFRYGARGIKLQESWENDPLAFFEYVKELPNFSPEMSIDRIDNDLNYCEGNLRWATPGQQVRNRGKSRNNTSGQCGVTWSTDKNGTTRTNAWWNSGGKTYAKTFSVKKYGLLPAFKMACDYREKMIQELNSQGAGYSPNHGK